MEAAPKRLGKRIYRKKVAITLGYVVTYRAHVLTEVWENFLVLPQRSQFLHPAFRHSSTPHVCEKGPMNTHFSSHSWMPLFFSKSSPRVSADSGQCGVLVSPHLLSGKRLPLSFLKSKLQTITSTTELQKQPYLLKVW